ncbi:MAG: GerW family sporulation protein [Clostridia bacterium]|nr:GerW family sporulation protein [Clostridia bacterium]
MKTIQENNKKSIESLIEGTLKNLREMVETNTIIGKALNLSDGSSIIPISKVSVGYVVGGGEYADVSRHKKHDAFPLAGGSGGGVSVNPVGFLIASQGEVRFIDIENKNAYQSVLKLFNMVIDKLKDKEGEKVED